MGKKVVVFGELNADLILSGTEVVPEPNKEKIVDGFELTLGSSSAITACRLAQLGLEVHFVSVVGADLFGRYCIEQLRRFGVNTDDIRIDEAEKTGATVSLSSSADRALITFMGTIGKLSPAHIPERVWEKADHLHFGSYYLQEGMKPHWLSLLQTAKGKGMSTSFDTGWDPREQWDRPAIDSLLAWTDLCMPSATEAQHIYGADTPEGIERLLPAVRGHLLIKEGKSGATHIAPDGSKQHVPGYPVKPVDTTGAGDSFNAGAIRAFLDGKPADEWLRLANACGALSVQYVGGTGGAVGLEQAAALMRHPAGR